MHRRVVGLLGRCRISIFDLNAEVWMSILFSFPITPDKLHLFKQFTAALSSLGNMSVMEERLNTVSGIIKLLI